MKKDPATEVIVWLVRACWTQMADPDRVVGESFIEELFRDMRGAKEHKQEMRGAPRLESEACGISRSGVPDLSCGLWYKNAVYPWGVVCRGVS